MKQDDMLVIDGGEVLWSDIILPLVFGPTYIIVKDLSNCYSNAYNATKNSGTVSSGNAN